MVGGREHPNQLCWQLVNHQEPFYISRVGFPGRDSACCRARAPAEFLLLCSPRKGLTLPEQWGFPRCQDGAPCPLSHPLEGIKQATSQGFAQHGLKGAGTKTLSSVTSALSLWTQALEWRSASFAAPRC